MPVIFVLDIFRQFLGTTAYSLGVTNAVPMLKGVPLGTCAAMCGSWVLLLPTMPLMSAARVIKCLATVPDGWPG